MPSATVDSLTAAQPSYPMPPTSATPLVPVQPPYFMPPADNTYSPQVQHRRHAAAISPTLPAAASSNSSNDWHQLCRSCVGPIRHDV